MVNPDFKAGSYEKHKDPEGRPYEAFLPASLNRQFGWSDKSITLLIEEAMRYLSELKAYSKLVPDADFFIQMHVAKEATLSSKIEGTKTSVDDAVLQKEDLDPEKVGDWAEVQNHICSINFATKELVDGQPLHFRLIRSAHTKLLSNVRGYGKRPGELRQKQNWIGNEEDIQKAKYIPPFHTHLLDLVSDLDKFWHSRDLSIPILIKVALAHYQFEAIHPFEDGNGRMGRLIITLQLIDAGVLSKPTLYISEYFDKYRRDYYDSLLGVSKKNDIESWLKFFLTGLAQTAKKSKETMEAIIDLRMKYEQIIDGGMGKRQGLGRELLKKLFSKPKVTIKDIEKMLSVSVPTANAIAADFERLGLFSEETGYTRNRIFALRQYLDLFKSH